MEPGLVTTIIPVFNRAAMLREAVASVLAQTYRTIEIIIVDDGSTDDTGRVADELAATNSEAGRLVARGEFIQHLDSDDLLLPRKFDIQVTALREDRRAGVAYGWTRFRRPDGVAEREPHKRTGEHFETIFPAMLQSRWWSTPSPLYRREVIDSAGPWTDLRVEEDWEYDCRIASLGPRLAFCSDWVCEVRRHDEGHLSGRGYHPSIMRDRARAHELIFEHARRAGIGNDTPEMKHYARELFLLARQCGAAGLADESRRLMALAQSASDARDMRVYELLARIIGWTRAGRASLLIDRLR
jgi:glycosyltransferase involved in cell wall biosynthesis